LKPTEEVNKLWEAAMMEMDWDEDKGDHVLELSVDTFMYLQKQHYYWWDINCRYDMDKRCWYFRGYLKIKVIREPLPEVSHIKDYTVEVETVPGWHHMAIHVQKRNGRYRYHDWEGNDAEYNE